MSVSGIKIDFLQLFNDYQDGIAIVDPESMVITGANLSWFRMTGYTIEDINAGSVTIEVLHSADELTSFANEKKNLMKKKKSILRHWKVHKKDGQTFYVDIHAYLIPAEQKNYVLGVFRDVSNEIEILEKIERSEERFRRIFFDSAVGMILSDLEGAFLQINDAFCKICGYTREELMKITFREITHPDDLMKDLENYKKLVNREIRNYTIEKRYIHKNGSIIWILLTASYLTDKHNEAGFLIGQIQDITEQKETEVRLLIKALEKAKELSEAKSLFLANMSHEIRTPMNGVLGVLQLLQKSNLNSDQTFLVEIARSSAESLLTIINDILDFSKIEAGKLKLTQKYFNLKQTLFDIYSLLRYQAEEKDVDLIVDYQINKEMLYYGDESRIRQILINLAGNAVKFTEKGSIKITAYIDQSSDREYLVIKVSDTGVGIPQDQLQAIFKIFEQADNTSTRKFGGTGLGLSISKQLANMMKGDIHVESSSGNGSDFSLILPSDFIQKDHSNTKNRKTISAYTLILGNQKIVDKFLHSYYNNDCSYSIIHYHVRNSDEFLDQYKQIEKENTKILALISNTDYDDQLDSFLQNHKNNPDFRCVYYSENSFRGEAEQAAEKGFHGYLSTPIDQQTFWKMICRVLNLENSQIEKNFIITKYLLEMDADESLNENGKKNTSKGKKYSVLLVEDNKVNQMIGIRMLEKINAECSIAENGQTAVKLLKEKGSAFDLILMDIHMPEMDGLEATKIIRNNLKIKIPIIAMSADAMVEDKKKAIRSGMDDYITKPVDQNILEEKLKKWIQ